MVVAAITGSRTSGKLYVGSLLFELSSYVIDNYDWISLRDPHHSIHCHVPIVYFGYAWSTVWSRIIMVYKQYNFGSWIAHRRYCFMSVVDIILISCIQIWFVLAQNLLHVYEILYFYRKCNRMHIQMNFLSIHNVGDSVMTLFVCSSVTITFILLIIW